MFEVYKDTNDQYRWRITAANNRIIGASTESYINRDDCIGNARLVYTALSRS